MTTDNSCDGIDELILRRWRYIGGVPASRRKLLLQQQRREGKEGEEGEGRGKGSMGGGKGGKEGRGPRVYL